jgi:hypothetical protein
MHDSDADCGDGDTSDELSNYGKNTVVVAS